MKETTAQLHNYIISVVQNGNKTNPIVSFYSVTNSFMSLIVSDADGKLLYRLQQSVSAGINSVQLLSGNLKTRGVKIVQLSLQNDQLVNRFIYN